MNFRYVFQHTDVGNQLQERAEPVTVFDAALAQLAHDMAYTMKEENGIGLAAPQVGIMKRLFVVAIDGGWQTYVNPRLLTHSRRMDAAYEGCLSCKDMPRGVVHRPRAIEAVWQGIEGKRRVGRLTGLRARVFLHELDHLHGALYTARVQPGEFLIPGEVA